MGQQSQANQAETTDDRSMLTDKELHYLKDFMSWELLAMKKCGDAVNRCEDIAIQQLFRDAGKKHTANFNTLLVQLQQHVST
jgi:hypothetical protein